MTWQQYNRTLHSSTDALFDLILTEPPRGLTASKARLRKGVDEFLDKREMEGFAHFAQRVLVPGGYLLLFAPAMYFREWVVLLRANDFNCMDFPLVIAKDSKGMQRENRLLFPQNICDHIVMAASRGKNSKGFEPDFNEADKLMPCSYKRKFAAIDRVPVVRSKLQYDGCQSIVCTSEKNPDLLAELMVTFSPPDAKVLDPYAGNMTTGAACLTTARRCTLIEKDPECFARAFNSLARSCKSQCITRANKDPGIIIAEKNCAHMNMDEMEKSEHDGAGGARDASVPQSSDQNAEDTRSVDGHDFHRNDNDNANRVYVHPTFSFDTRSDDPENCGEVVSSSGGAISIPSVPSTPVERPTQCSQREEGKVKLLRNGDVAATADIAIEHGDTECYRKTLHGHSLSKFQKHGENLVVVWNVRVADSCKDYTYQYSYGGIEGPVTCLGEMETGFHAWDLNAMLFEN